MAAKKTQAGAAMNAFASNMQKAKIIAAEAAEAASAAEESAMPEDKPGETESVNPTLVDTQEQPQADIGENATEAKTAVLEKKPAAQFSPIIIRAKKRVASPQAKEEKEPDPRKNVVVPPPKKEARSEPLLLRVRPSLKARVEALCEKTGVSINEAGIQLFENWLHDNE